MLFPISGASYETRSVVWPAATLTADVVGGRTTRTAPAVASIRGPITYTILHTLQTGAGQEAPATLAVAAGTSRDSRGAGSLALEVRAVTTRASRSGLSVSAARPSLSVAALGALGVQTSLAVRAAALAGYTMRRQVTRALPAVVTVRGAKEAIVRRGLQVAAREVWPGPAALQVGGLVERTVPLAADVRNGASFFILADVVEADPVGEVGDPPAGYYTGQFITGRLFVNGDEVDISEFDYDKPRDKLGARLNLTLTYPSLQPVPLRATLRFDLVVEFRGVERTYTLVDQGRLGGRDISISLGQGRRPADEATVAGVDVLQDKFSLRPTRPVVLYDSDRVTYNEVEVQQRDAVHFEDGTPIMPVLEPHANLTMLKVLERAFTNRPGSWGVRGMTSGLRAQLGLRYGLVSGHGTTFEDVGLGFERVVTNIPDYPVKRADFTIEGGWKDGADPFVAMYNPAYFVRANWLYVMDTERVLPYGVVPRPVTVDDYTLLSLSWPYKDFRNAVLLTHMAEADETEVFYTSRVETPEAQESGRFGEAGYSKTETSIRIKEARLLGDPGVILAEFVESVETKTYVDYGYGAILSHREIEQTTYQNDMKVGHDKRVYGLVTVGREKSLTLREVLREVCAITWNENPLEPGSYTQARNDTLVTGLVYLSDETQKVLTPEGEKEVPIKVPALYAQKSGFITDDGTLEEGRPIKRITEVLRQGRGNQVDVQTTVIDFLTGTIDRSTTQPRTGSRATSNINARQVTTLLFEKDGPNGETAVGPRIPEPVNAGELPRDRALELGHRILDSLTSPTAVKRLNISGADVTLERGSVIRAFMRDGTPAGDFMVLGYGIKGTNLGRKGHNVVMSVEGVELPTG